MPFPAEREPSPDMGQEQAPESNDPLPSFAVFIGLVLEAVRERRLYQIPARLGYIRGEIFALDDESDDQHMTLALIKPARAIAHMTDQLLVEIYAGHDYLTGTDRNYREDNQAEFCMGDIEAAIRLGGEVFTFRRRPS